MSEITLAVIGCGVIGKAHLKGIAAIPQARLMAVCDLNPETARAAASEFGAPVWHTDANAILTDPAIQAVILATPLQGRSRLAIEALHYRKHVLIEKPLAFDVLEARRILVSRQDCIAMPCSARFRLYESAQAAEKVIRDGALGRIRILRCRGVKSAGAPPQTPPPVWRVNKSLNGGGILVNWGVYDLDYLLSLAGWSPRPRLVLAHTWPVSPRFSSYVAPGSDAETHVAALVRCDGGEIISLERAEFVPTTTEEAWQIIGDNGSLRLNMIPGKKQMWLDQATPAGVESKIIWEGEEDYAAVHANLAREFIAAIAEHRQSVSTLEQAIVIQQITDAIYVSAESGGAVTIEE